MTVCQGPGGEHFESKEKVERRNAEDFSHLNQQENAVLSKVTSDTTNIIMNKSSKEDENTEAINKNQISADEEYLLRNQSTIYFPERFSEWSDEQRRIAYDCNFTLYMEKFMETIPSLTAPK